MTTFGTRLRTVVDARGPLCVGIDPHAELLARWGLSDDASGLAWFVRTVTDALADRVAVFKPQSAFFERFGSRGIHVLERTLRALRRSGALTILDVKRGDIGATAAGYAAAYLDPHSALSADALTVHPYLGVGSLTPMVEEARTHGGGLFVLARTSNPEAVAVQAARLPDGRSVAQSVVDAIAQLNEGTAAGSFGVVAGATQREPALDLSRLHGPVLAPGIGAQGAQAADLRPVFGSALGTVLPAVSRQVLSAGPDPQALRDVVDRVAADCRTAFAAAPHGQM